MRDLYEIFQLSPPASPAAGPVVFIHEENLISERELLGLQLRLTEKTMARRSPGSCEY